MCMAVEAGAQSSMRSHLCEPIEMVKLDGTRHMQCQKCRACIAELETRLVDTQVRSHDRQLRITELEASTEQAQRYLDTEREVASIMRGANSNLSARIAELETALLE